MDHVEPVKFCNRVTGFRLRHALRLPPKDNNVIGPELRIIQLERRHAAQAIKRAWLIARGTELETDLANLAESCRELIAEVTKEPTT